jgi:hypothetical protein
MSPNRQTALKIGFALTVASAALPVLGVRRTTALIGKLVPPSTDGPPLNPSQQARGLAERIAAVAKRIPGKPTCLPQALVLQAGLRRRGIESLLRLGVRQVEPFEAHAWVEVDGVTIDPAEVSDLKSKSAFFTRVKRQ